MHKIKRICVFLGSNLGAKNEYLIATRKLGALLAERDITLVYGGSNQGLMGELAGSVLKHGGKVIGVIPECLIKKNHAHTALSEIIATQSMTERKTLLKSLADGFIILPGGVGTLDELFEVLTENKVGLHNKPIGVLNVSHFYNPMLQLLENMVTANFFSQTLINNLIVDSEPEQLLNKLVGVKHEPILLKNSDLFQFSPKQASPLHIPQNFNWKDALTLGLSSYYLLGMDSLQTSLSSLVS